MDSNQITIRQERDAYRIKDAAEFTVQIQELIDGAWQPYR